MLAVCSAALTAATARARAYGQTVVYYNAAEVVAPAWHAMEQRLASADTVDKVLQLHDEFLKTCLHECLLDDKELEEVRAQAAPAAPVCGTDAPASNCCT